MMGVVSPGRPGRQLSLLSILLSWFSLLCFVVVVVFGGFSLQVSLRVEIFPYCRDLPMYTYNIYIILSVPGCMHTLLTCHFCLCARSFVCGFWCTLYELWCLGACMQCTVNCGVLVLVEGLVGCCECFGCVCMVLLCLLLACFWLFMHACMILGHLGSVFAPLWMGMYQH